MTFFESDDLGKYLISLGLIGSDGKPTAEKALFQLFAWTFGTATSEPPSNTQLRFNSSDFRAVTRLWARFLTDESRDVYYALMRLPAGSTWWVQDKNDHTRVVRFTTTGPAVDKDTYAEFPVQWVSDSGVAFANSQPILAVLALR